MIPEILIVDDNADIRNIINELILDVGYKTRIAANYNQALAEIDKNCEEASNSKLNNWFGVIWAFHESWPSL